MISQNETILCTIPARAGSKRLPKKNMLPLAGKPMIAYSIETAINSELFDDVYVCTEDEHIAEIARQYGAKVPFLMPPDLCGDLVPSHVPCQHLAQFVEQEGQTIETLVCLQPTSPLRSVQDIRQGVEHFQQGGFDFLMSVTPIDPHYFHWALIPGKTEEWQMYFGKQYLIERPLLPPVYRPNGSIKIAKLTRLRETGSFIGPKLGVIETPEERSVHVGTQFDFALCEFLFTR